MCHGVTNESSDSGRKRHVGPVSKRDRTVQPAGGWERVYRNAGCSGGDGVTIRHLEPDISTHLIRLHHALATDIYTPGPLRLVNIPKEDGSARRLAIPCVADRIVQTAAVRRLTPVMEAVFADSALSRVGDLSGDLGLTLKAGKTRVVDFDRGFRFPGHLFVRSMVSMTDLTRARCPGCCGRCRPVTACASVPSRQTA